MDGLIDNNSITKQSELPRLAAICSNLKKKKCNKMDNNIDICSVCAKLKLAEIDIHQSELIY